MAVVLVTKVSRLGAPSGGTLMSLVHGTRLSCILATSSSTACNAHDVSLFTLDRKLREDHIWSVISWIVSFFLPPWSSANSGACASRKECMRGKGTRFTPILRRSPLSLPLKRSDAVMPLIVIEITQFRSLYLGSFCFSTLCEIENSASLSITKVSSEFSSSWWIDSVALYGSTTTSLTLGEGYTEKVAVMRSG